MLGPTQAVKAQRTNLGFPESMGEVRMGEESRSVHFMDWCADAERRLGRDGGFFNNGGYGQADPRGYVDEFNGWAEDSFAPRFAFPQTQDLGQTGYFFM